MDKENIRLQNSRQAGGIEIRPFEARDAHACFKIRSAAFIRKFYGELGARATSAGVNAFMPDDYIRLAETAPFFVGQNNSGIIGFFALTRPEPTAVEIALIYVALNQLGRNIGRRFMAYIEQWVSANWPEVTTIIVDTIIPEYNSGFYKKAGFVPAGDAVCSFPEMAVPALRLKKTLGS